MKNFTNNFKQFTSRLSARWFIIALMLLLGTSSAWAADKVIYITTGTSTGYFNPYIYVWNNSSNNGWPGKAMESAGKTSEGYPVYKYTWTSEFSSFIVMDGNCGDGCKKTGDVSYSKTQSYIYNVKTGNWSSYTPTQSATFSFSLPELYVGTPATITYSLSPSNAGSVSFSCTTSNATISGNQITANSSGTVTVKATITYNSGYSGTTTTSQSTTAYIPAATKLYLKPTGWTSDNAKFSAYFFTGTSTNQWKAATVVCNATDVYEVELPSGKWTNLIWCRMNPSGSQEAWSGSWGQTVDLIYEGKNLYTINNAYGCGDNKSCGVWDTYTPPSCCTDVNVPNVTSDGPICAGSTATLTLTNRQDGVTYRLNNATTGDIIFGSEDTYTTPAALNDNTTYTIYASHEDACDGADNVPGTVTVTVNAIPATPNVIKSATVCPNTDIALSSYDNGVANVSWYTNQQCEQEVTSSISIDANKTYYARAENGNCYSDVVSLALSVYEAPAAPDLSPSGKINVGQNKSATITVINMDANATYVCKNANDQEVGTWNGNSVTFNVGDATGEFTYTIVATHGTCADLSTPTEFTVKVEEAGVKIAALGSTALYTNDPTHFIPMYVSNEYLAGVDANSVTNYTWQYSEDGTSDWTDCTRSYSNFNAANNQSNGNVVVTNGSINCNNWRANQAGYYRCKLTYDNDEDQVSGNIQVTEATNNKTNKQHIGITYNLPIISVNTGATDFPSDADLATESSNCGNSRYPSIHADDLKKKRSVDVMMFNPDGTICYDRKARMNYRGSSSLNFQKKSYAFCPGKEKCGDDEKGAEYVKTNKENLFGLSNGAADKDWVLYAATPDPSMMRNRLVFDLYKKMRPDEWGVNSMYVELVVNGEYRGVYVLMDKITNNANRVNIKNENGFIVKFDKTDVVDRVENTEGDQKTFATSRTGTKNSSNGNESYGTCIDQRFEIEYPEKEDIQLWDAFYGNVQQRFEDFETALANKDYATVRTLIDYDSWADWFIITELAKNQDGFRASCIFVYDGDKIEARPLWDQELSFNNGTRVKHGIADPEGLLITTSSVYDDAFYPPFWFTGNKGTTVTGGLLNDPCFVSLVKQKWATYQSGVCSAASIGTMVAAYNTELGDAINREAARWPYDEATRGTTTDGDYIGYYSQGEGNPSQYSYAASKAAITAWASDRSTALDTNSGLGKAINDLNGEALIFTISPSSVETTPWKQVLLTVNAPEGYEYTFDDSSINNATVRASVKKDNNTYAIKIPRPTAWGIGGNGDPDTQTQYQVSATIEVSGESECGTIQNGTATSTITLTDVTEDCNPEIVKP